MRTKWWLGFVTAVVLAIPGTLLADEHGHGHGRDKHHDRDDDRDNDHGHGHKSYRYSDHDRDEIRGWYRDHDGHLPPGLAKRDRLSPGLERQLQVRGTLPPGLRRKMVPCPVELERRLPPPPSGYGNFAIGGHIVLVNRSNFLVLDVFQIEQ